MQYFCSDKKNEEHPELVFTYNRAPRRTDEPENGDHPQYYLNYGVDPPEYYTDDANIATLAFDNLFTRYNMTCRSSGIISLPQTMYFLGAVTGALTIPALSDIYGRRKTFLWCAGVSVIMFIIQAIMGKWPGTKENQYLDNIWSYYVI